MLRKLLPLLLVLACGYAHAALQIQSWTLENGARVLFVENHTIPILDVSVEFDAGSRRDPAGKAGTAALTNGLLARGLRKSVLPGQIQQVEPARSEAQISDAFADIAAERGGAAGSDRAGVSLRTLSSETERKTAIRLLARVMAQPSFPADVLARDKARLIAAIKEELTKPQSIADRAFSRVIYGAHPYGKEQTVESVQAITRGDLVAFHRSHYVANRAVIAMIGDVTRAEADAIAHQLTLRLPRGEPLPALPAVPMLPSREEWIVHPASQSHILIGTPALARGDADYFPLMVGNYVLGGGGFVSRLTEEVREKRGLAYSVYSYFNPLAQEGPFEIGLQTKKEQTDQALKIARDTLAAYLKNGPTPQEIQAAKDNLIGGFALRIDNNRKILGNIAVIGFYNLPLDYLDTWTTHVAEVTLDDIRAAFNRKIALDRLSTVVVGTAQP
ncbi:MAG TPA: pitrilysin family protein [Burkholderiaceae bacterium]|jgi:zinc protease|nr:pitrilysin family protein [Burkholderiaceae bacterium]